MSHQNHDDSGITHQERRYADRQYGEIIRDHLETLKAIRAGRSQLSRREREQCVAHVMYQRYSADEFHANAEAVKELNRLAKELSEEYGVPAR